MEIKPLSSSLVLAFVLLTLTSGSATASRPASGQQRLDAALEELGKISLSERQLRQLAGSAGFKPYVLNPVVAPGGQGTWDAGALGSATVIKVGHIYHMYYEAWGKLDKAGSAADYDTLQIGHAVSLDGVHWVKDPANPVMRRGAKGQWDCNGTWDPFVIHEDGRFKMWYGGESANGDCNWGYSTSTDGTHFVKQGQISHLGHVEDDHVVHDRKQGEYFMFYWDRAKAPWDKVMKGPPDAPSGLFVARSRNETNFDFSNGERLTIQGQPWPGKYSQVLWDGKCWVMFYGEAKVRGMPSRTGIAVSDDLVTWKKSAFPLIHGHDAEVVEAAPNLWLMYYGPEGYFDMPKCDIRLAIYQGALEGLRDAH